MAGSTAAASWPQRLRDAVKPAIALLILIAAAQALGIAAHRFVPRLPGTVPSAFMGSYEATPRVVGQTTTAFGVLLVGAWLAGRITNALGLPRLSGNLLFGVVAGPSMAAMLGVRAIIGAEELGSLKLIEGLAVTMIALAAGSEIKLAFVRKSARTIIRVVTGEFLSVVPAVFVTLVGILFLLPLPGALAETSAAIRLYIAGLVALLAVAASPAVTIALLKEMRATGVFAQLALCISVLKDVVLVVLFSIVLAIGIAMIGTGGDTATAVADPSILGVAFTIGLHLIGSILLGVGVAVVFWLLARFLRMRIEMFMVLACFGIAVISDELHANALLVALSAGMILTNIAPERANERLLATLDGLLPPVYCVFFAVAGAKLQMEALAAVWPAMLAVVGVRLMAKKLGVTRACRKAGVAEPAASWLWTSTMPQAGVTLAMANQFDRAMGGHPWATSVSALLLAMVACNELIGPPLLKLGVIRAGAAGPALRARG